MTMYMIGELVTAPCHGEGEIRAISPDRQHAAIKFDDKYLRTLLVAELNKTESSTHTESVGEGHTFRIQHCEHQYENGNFCDYYLGVNYPSYFCVFHQTQEPTT